jgi:hypothetical protein
MRIPVLAAGPRGSVLAQNRKGVFLTDFVDKFTRQVLQYHEAGVNLS